MRGAAVLLTLIAMGLAGCGGDQGGTVHHRKPDATPVASGPAASRTIPPKITTGRRVAKPLAKDQAEASQAPPTGENDPCSLVSRAEARVIVGRTVGGPTLAPQGPTCIYDAGKRSVTLALQALPLEASTPGGSKVVKLEVAGHRAYCVDQDGSRLLVPLEGGQTLAVGANCPVAARFAAKALARLSG